MRLLTITFAAIQENFHELDSISYDEKGGIDALNAITIDLEPLYNPGYINPDGEAAKNREALAEAFKDLRKLGQQSKELSETTFTNKQGTENTGVDAVKSMSTDVEALNQENP